MAVERAISVLSATRFDTSTCRFRNSVTNFSPPLKRGLPSCDAHDRAAERERSMLTQLPARQAASSHFSSFSSPSASRNGCGPNDVADASRSGKRRATALRG